MVFTLINKEGAKLSAVEILSAKPAWNIPVKNVIQTVEDQKKKLYAAINTSIDAQATVRWDYPATLYDRLEDLSFLFPRYDYESKLEKAAMGF